VPDESDRRRVLRGNFAIMIEHALINGRVHVFDDGSGTAVWLACPTHHIASRFPQPRSSSGLTRSHRSQPQGRRS
jgi:hypothetical protein